MPETSATNTTMTAAQADRGVEVGIWEFYRFRPAARDWRLAAVIRCQRLRLPACVRDPLSAARRPYSHLNMSTGGTSSRKLSTIRISISGRNHFAQRSQGIFATPSTPIVTAAVGRIGLMNSQSWYA